MNKKMSPDRLVVLLLISLLAACNGSSNDGEALGEGQLVPIESDEQMVGFLRSGLANDKNREPTPIANMGVTESNEAINFSSTNLIEPGVDELDRIKFDGRYLFVAELGVLGEESRVVVYDTSPNIPSAQQVAAINLPDVDRVGGLYLDNGTLTVLTHTWRDEDWGLWLSLDYWEQGRMAVYVFDVSAPETPKQTAMLEFDGRLVESRRIGQYLYLVSRYAPSVEAELSEDADIDVWLPGLTVNAQATPWFEASDCYVPAAISEENSTSIITVLTAIDLENSAAVNARCYTGNTSGFYTSNQAIYLSRINNERTQTDIHKFSFLGDGVEYAGSGTVPGHFNGRNPQFRMNEYDGYLRVVSDTRDDWAQWPELAAAEEPASVTVEHYLTVLAPSNSTRALEIVGQIPNADQPSPIGKPDEDIFAVRFVGERAYIVTFLEVDPFYVVDLEDPASPVLAGELEIPGFSNLLQPINEDFIIGFGQTSDWDFYKLELFDVSDASNPQTVDTINISAYFSTAANDHHALTVSPQPDGFTTRLAIPLVADNCSSISLQLAEVNTSNATLINRGTLLPDGDENPNGIGYERSVLVNDTVYYLFGNTITSAFWSEGNINNGC